MTVEICTVKDIAQELKISVRTVERLEEKSIFKLRRTITGKRYCLKKDLEKIVNIYLNCRKNV